MQNYIPPQLHVHGTVERLTRQAFGKQPISNDGNAGVDGLANSKCAGGTDGSQATHNASENPLLCS